MLRTMMISLAATTALAAGAQASDICQPHAEADWMSMEDMSAKAVEMGYEVRKIQKEDGCWEVKGMKDGKRVEAYFDPVTAELVLTK